MACDFTRADVDNLCRALNEASRIEWIMYDKPFRDCTQPIVPTQFVTRATFDQLAKVTGARVERNVARGSHEMDMISYGGTLFYAFAEGTAY